MPEPLTIHTIGHSTRPLADFIALLQENGIDCVVDVRAFPGSRRHPQFNRESLEAALPAKGLAYVHMRALGGRRKADEALVDSPNTLWRNDSFRRYADHALSEEFREALEALEALAREHRCALMCAEAVWWRCHRRLIADWLLARGHDVRHILNAGKTEAASLTPGARVTDSAQVIYPAGPEQGSLL